MTEKREHTTIKADPGWYVVNGINPNDSDYQMDLDPIIAWEIVRVSDKDSEGFSHLVNPITINGIRRAGDRPFWMFKRPDGRFVSYSFNDVDCATEAELFAQFRHEAEKKKRGRS